MRVKLGDICEIGSSTRIFAEEYVDEGIPFFRSKETIELSEGKLSVSEPLFISRERFNEIKASREIPKKGDILLSAVGAYLGIPYWVNVDYDFYFKDGNIIWLRNFDSKVNSKYIYWLIKSNIFQKQFHFKSIGAAQKALTIDSLKQYDISLPTLETQNDIVAILDALDKKILNNNKINAELESMAKTLYDYWFLQFEFPNEEGKPYKSSGGKMVWNEELKREIPEGWKARKIVNILNEADKSKVQVNEAKEKGGYPFFTSGNSILSYDEFFVDGFNIFLNTGGNPDIKAYMGKCAYSTDTWCISANEYSYVLYYYLLKLMPQFEQLFFAGSGLKHLQKKALKNKYILLPDIRVLKIFNDSCVSIWKKVANYYIQNQELSSLRDFLLPLLLNGQVTFKENKLWIG